jgi:hypothetical protein
MHMKILFKIIKKREVGSPKPGRAMLSSGIFEYDYFGGGVV